MESFFAKDKKIRTFAAVFRKTQFFGNIQTAEKQSKTPNLAHSFLLVTTAPNTSACYQ